MYKSRENNIINPLPTFKNNKLHHLLTYDLLFDVFSLPFLELPSLPHYFEANPTYHGI